MRRRKTKIRSVLLTVMLLGMLMSPLSMAAGVAVGYWQNSVPLGVAVFFLLPVVITLVAAGRENARAERYGDEVQEALEHPDYWFSTNYGAIAVDATNRKISGYFRNYGSRRKPTLSVISWEEIKGWGTPTAQAEMVELLGANGPGTYSLHRDAFYYNMRARGQAYFRTGILIETNELENDRYFFPVPAEWARNWSKLLAQLKEGKLKAQQTPKLFPEVYRF